MKNTKSKIHPLSRTDFHLSMGYKKDIFAVLAYEFEPSQFLHENIRLAPS